MSAKIMLYLLPISMDRETALVGVCRVMNIINQLSLSKGKEVHHNLCKAVMAFLQTAFVEENDIGFCS